MFTAVSFDALPLFPPDQDSLASVREKRREGYTPEYGHDLLDTSNKEMVLRHMNHNQFHLHSSVIQPFLMTL